MIPYYNEAGITIYHDDCMKMLTPKIGQFDLIFTSPPYNMGDRPWGLLGGGAGGQGRWVNGANCNEGVLYDGTEDKWPWPDYVTWQQNLLTLFWSRLTSTGAIFYNHKPRVVGDRLWMPTELNPGLPLRQIIIWSRGCGLNFNMHAYVPTHEWIMIFATKDFRLKSRSQSGLGDVWYVPQEQPPNPHPAPFPLALPARAIESTRTKSILDPFMGSGTTLVAAKAAGIRAVGIEKSERYCEMAARRLAQEVLDLGV